MDDDQFAELAAACHRAIDPLHAMIYFAPEAEEEFTAVGLRRGRMCYFAGRAAPMGAVSGGTVSATFHNFNPELVARHIPHAWTLATPEQILSARSRAADRALHRLLGDTVSAPEVAEAAELAGTAAQGCTPEGRPLYAANAELEWPEEPHLALWHAVTLLREFRGDGHIASLVTNGLDGLSALVTHTATGKGFTREGAQATRGWSEQQWATAEERLAATGILTERGELTSHGEGLRERIETATDYAATSPWLHLGAAKTRRLRDICKDLRSRIVSAGAFPADLFASG